MRPEAGLEKISFLTRAGDEAAYAALRRQLQAKYGAGEDETFNDTETCRKIIPRDGGASRSFGSSGASARDGDAPVADGGGLPEDAMAA